MIRTWLFNLIQEAVFKFFVELETRISLIETDINVIRIMLEKQQQSRAAQEQEQSSAEQAQEPVQALAASRPSWPRMKKQLEERDVRGILAAQSREREELVGNRPPISTQVDGIEKYWRDKQEKQKGI